MTLARWLAERQPAPPTALAGRLAVVLGRLDDAEADVPDAMLATAERLLGELLREGSLTRDAALDLLTVDALVTYAFEAASEQPETLEARATDSMGRIAAIALAS